MLFGSHIALREAFPHFFLDYREERNEPGFPRWDDRVCSDGTWSGNLFDFYRKVYPRLVSELRIPFQINEEGYRIDDTPIHQAIREALANTLSHADYDAQTNIIVQKQPDRFIFTNPGRLRLPLEKVLHGGTSDPRNETIHRVFLLLGIAERAGSGIPKILQAWKEQHWRAPQIEDLTEPEQTRLTLTTASLLPKDAVQEVQAIFGASFNQLTPDGRIIVVTAFLEGNITHERLSQLLGTLHSRDVTLLLQFLVRKDFLEKQGIGRGSYYQILFPPTDSKEDKEEGSVHKEEGSVHKEEGSVHKEEGSVHKEEGSVHKEEGSVHKEEGSVHKEEGSVHSSEDELLQVLAVPFASSKRVSKRELLEKAILDMCRIRPLSSEELGNLLNRKPESLRIHYLRHLVHSGMLTLRYPERITHPMQAYITTTFDSDDSTS